ncbi:MAG: hypothetical protein RMK84_12845 [Oscillochloridaceae bacterium]|nr:hypothetical protein [Chloroflexaceae bacterium]MDW8391007.1 hypothetical protein [Oscillochloridaceae bacterium]
MEEPREQQPVAAPPHPASLYGDGPPPGMYVASPAPSAPGVAARVARLLFHRAFWYAEQLWLVARPNLGWIILTTFLLGVIGFLSLLLILPRLTREQPADIRVAWLQPAPAVVDFLRGQQTYDADLMWNSFSPSFQESLQARDFTRDVLAEQMEQERRNGQRYRKFEYIGGVRLPDNQAMYFYVVEVSVPRSARTRSISFVFTVDRDGKIVAIE